MKKQFIFLTALLLLVRMLSISQEADLIYMPLNKQDDMSLKEMVNNTGTSTEASFSVVGIQPPGSPSTIFDLYHTVYANLYYVTDDIAKPALQEVVTLNVTIDVVGKDINGNTVTRTLNGDLEVSPLKDRSTLVFHYGKEELFPYNLHSIASSTIKFTKSDVSHIDQTVLDILRLELNVDYARYDVGAGSFALKFIDTDPQLKQNEVIIYWNEQPKPCIYELEWVHVSTTSFSTNFLDYDFSENAVRIQTKENYYPLNLLFEDGFIVARVRTVRPTMNVDGSAILDKKMYGQWSDYESGTFNSQAILPYNVLEITQATSDPLHTANWQYNATYSTSGKKKEMLAFYDGSNRNRQNISLLSDFDESKTFSGGEKVNYKSTVLAQESYYDYNGEIIIEALGIPLPSSNKVGFQSGINELSGSKLLKNNYDGLLANSAPQMDISATSPGAAQYYSPYNSLYVNSGNELTDYLPNAGGFPFTRKELLRDGSGRIKVDYLAGADLANDDSKNARYFYAKPTAVELERLFGTNIGQANFYKKNAIVDPNGAVSYSYVDQTNRTVATSHAGEPHPRSQMIPLANENNNVFTEDFLQSGAETFNENDYSFEVTYPIFVPTGGDYIFEYSFDLNTYSPFCINLSTICYNCAYQYSFQIVDDQGNLVLESKDDNVSFNQSNCLPQTFTMNQIDYQNGVYATTNGSQLTVNLLPMKTYTVVKKLSLLTDNLELAADHFVNSSGCLPYDLEYFVNDELSNADFESCEKEFEDVAASECLAMRNKMLEDFQYPNGYFVEDAPLSASIADYIIDRLNVSVNRGSPVFNSFIDVTNNTLFYSNFNDAFIQEFGLSGNPTFADWDDVYMEYFLKFHPSIPKLETCGALHSPNSTEFDKVLAESNTIQEFVTEMKARGLMAANENIQFVGNDIVTSPSSTPPGPKGTLTGRNFMNGNGRNGGQQSYSVVNNLYPQNIDVNDAYKNDFALLRFDPDYYLFDNHHSFGYTYGYPFANNYIAAVAQMKHLLPSNRHCTVSTPMNIGFHGGDLYNSTLHYLADFFGCQTTGAVANKGIKEIAFTAPNNERKWQVFKSLYANVKAMNIRHLIQVAVWHKSSTPGTDVNRYPDFANHDYYDYEFYVGEPTKDLDPTEASNAGQTGTGVYNDALDPTSLANDVANLIDGQGLFSSASNKAVFIGSFIANTSSGSTSQIGNFICDPFTFINNISTGLLIPGADAYSVNVASITNSYLRFYANQNGTPFFSCSRQESQFNCYDFSQAHSDFVTAFNSFNVLNEEAIEIDNPTQVKYKNWMNWKLGLNLSFIDYFRMSESCVLVSPGNTTSDFGSTVDWGNPSTKVEAIKTAVINYGKTSNNYLRNLTNPVIASTLNTAIPGTSNDISLTTDHIGFGAIDLNNSQFDFFYLENGVTILNSLQSKLNSVFSTIKTELQTHPDFETAFSANCIKLNIASNTPVSGTSLLVDRAYRYADGTVWVRLLNSNQSYYDDYYFHYTPYNGDYRLNEVNSFNGIVPVFDQENLHYVTLTTTSGEEMLASTASEIAIAERIARVELNDYEGEGWFPLDKGCEDIKYADAVSVANLRYKEYLEEQKRIFKENHIKFCTNQQSSKAISNRTFTMTYTSSERHFTLFYYDQADNLVMTVPPKGVQPIIHDQTIKQQIRDYRTGLSSTEVLPPHTLTTKYRYNSEKQLIEQVTPNGGTSRFWYDRAGRLVLSQNDDQMELFRFSYTLYDNQGRVKEVGEATIDELAALYGVGEETWENIQHFIITDQLNGVTNNLENLIFSNDKNDITRSYYDDKVINNAALPAPPSDFDQNNLRSRVATQAYFDLIPAFSNSYNWQFATHYSYDPVGNVETVLNDYYQAGLITTEADRFKRLDYAYDPVSGNVERLYYQLGKEDAFIHAYEYDAENRVTGVKTSRDGIIWDEDATYDYYLHGPLARIELGEHKVQGIDYAHNLHGWLKTINAGHKNADIGGDHQKTSVGGSATDAFGLNIHYNQFDYQPISGQTAHLLAANTGTDHSDLFNGNISAISVHNQEESFGRRYVYDQINRIKSSEERIVNDQTLAWGGDLPQSNSSFYNYDQNGNLIWLQRRDGASQSMMDEMTYHYQSGTDRLSSVDDAIASASFPNDIDQQPVNNYAYDGRGNLIADQAENIQQIQWYPNGKIKRIVRNNSPTKAKPNLSFEYDALGNRVKKTVNFIDNGRDYYKTTYYVRDANGNNIATYDEIDCKFANDPNNPGYYQVSHPFSFYTTEAMNQVGSGTVYNFLNGTFSRKAELCEQARIQMQFVPNARDLIFLQMYVGSYVDLYPDAIARILANDPYHYANYLFLNNQADFIELMNDKNEAYIQYLLVNSKVTDFYDTYNSLYKQYLSLSEQLENAEPVYTMNREVLVSIIMSNKTLFMDMLGLDNDMYNEVLDVYNDPSNANAVLQDYLDQLQQLLSSGKDNKTVKELIFKINAILMICDIDQLDINDMLDPIDLDILYDALNWIKPFRSQVLNSVLHHLNIIDNWTVGSGRINVSKLFTFKPMDAAKWTSDVNGDFLKYFLHLDFSNPNVRDIAEKYFIGVNMTDPVIYFSSNASVWQYVFDAMQRNSTDPMFDDAVRDIANTIAGLNSLYVTENMTHLTNYLKHYDPKKLLEHNYNHDELQSAFMGLLHYSPLQYAEELEAQLGVEFGLPLGCSTHLVTLNPTSFEIYGKRRLGVMDASGSRKLSDNSYTRKLGEKTYELADHLDNVWATVTDKKLHPQELETLGSASFNTTLGYQPQVSGRYDRYPFGMEIMSRSGDFTISDYTQNEYIVIFQGFPGSCADYSSEYGACEITNCSTSSNAYGQDFVDGISAGYSNSGGQPDQIKLKIRPVMGQLIPNLDPIKKYRIEIHLESTSNRHTYGRLNTNSATWATSISAGSGASSAQIDASNDKLITLEHTGAELQSYVYTSGTHQGRFLIEVVAGAPPVNVPVAQDIVLTEVVITQIDENINVPLAHRDESAYRYAFNGMERDDEVRGPGTTYEFANRSIYDARLGRFVSVDISANKFPGLSPYAFAGNKPISHKDQEGEFAQMVIKYGVDVAINIASQMMMAYMFDDNVNSFGEAWDETSLLSAFGEGLVDQLGTKKLKMAGSSVLALFDYIDEVGIENMNAEGAITAMGVGLLEPLIGDALEKYGAPAVMKGLEKMGVDPKQVANVLGIKNEVLELGEQTTKKASFVVTPDGTAVSTDLKKVQKSFDNAGFKKVQDTPSNSVYEVPKSDGSGTFYSRIQQGNDPRKTNFDGDRVVNTQNTGNLNNKQYVNPDGSNITGNPTKSERKATGHIQLEPGINE